MGKEKAARIARESTRARQAEVGDDADDWFSNGHKRPGDNSGNGSDAKRARANSSPHNQRDNNRKGRKDKHSKDPNSSEAVDEVAAWFASKDGQQSGAVSRKGKARDDSRREESREEREERKYLEYQVERGGRYDEAEDHGIHSRSRDGGRHDHDRNDPREGQRSRRSSKRSSRNRTPEHRGARDRKDRVSPEPSSARPSSSSKPSASVPHLAISIRGASDVGRSALLKKRQKHKPRGGDDRTSHGQSTDTRYPDDSNNSSSRFGPKWKGGYVNG